MTALEFAKIHGIVPNENTILLMQGFAKYNVKEALKEASEKSLVGCFEGNKLIFDSKEIDDSEDKCTYKIVKPSILNAYPEELIK